MSAFNVTSERMTTSRQGPWYVQRDDHSFHVFSVLATTAAASAGPGGGSCEGYQLRTNGTRDPSVTSNSATVVNSRPCISTGVCKQTASGPPIAVRIPSAVRCTHGRIAP